jgi:hypothetical protein
MNDIRKIATGSDINRQMVYTVGQHVIQDSCLIHHIKINEKINAIEVYVIRCAEIILWKSIGMTMPYTIEYNIDFQ